MLATRWPCNYSRDNNLTEFGKSTLIDRYLLPGEKFQDMFMRVARNFSDDDDHAQRIYDYISKLWFMPATPVLSNGGASRGLPISCFLNTVQDSLDGILSTWSENVWLASNGGGTIPDAEIWIPDVQPYNSKAGIVSSPRVEGSSTLRRDARARGGCTLQIWSAKTRLYNGVAARCVCVCVCAR